MQPSQPQPGALLRLPPSARWVWLRWRYGDYLLDTTPCSHRSLVQYSTVQYSTAHWYDTNNHPIPLRRFVSALPPERQVCGRSAGVRPGIQEIRRIMRRGWIAQPNS
jgi:hypothetical protein